MNTRRLRYWVGYVLRFWTRLVVGLLLEPLSDRLGRCMSFEGIKIVAPPGDEAAADAPFVRYTVDTLRLIQAVDPRRFRRIRREIAVIVDVPNLAPGMYTRPGRRCTIDFARYSAESREKYPEWYQWLYAKTLVHEATHGAIYSRYVHYTRKLRGRIERLCCTEARRFATRADREDRQWSEALVPPFDEARWHEDWNLWWWQRARRSFARMREVSRQRQRR